MESKTEYDKVLDEETGNIREKYDVLETIGQGTFGLVRKCRCKISGRICAMKTILKSKVPSLAILKKEVELLSEVDHPHIIKLYEAFEEDNKLHLVTELCTGGELYDRVVEKSLCDEQHFSEYDAARILRNILEAIDYCHSEKKICHRDLKVENFLLLHPEDDSPVKIIDFGLSRFNPDNVMTSRVGTVYYVAPEVLLSDNYSDKCDIWSIGVIAYVLLCGFPPFHGENESLTLKLVKEAAVEFPSPIWDDVSQEAKDFILRLLNRNPDERPSAREALQDPWLLHEHVQPQGVSQRASFIPSASHPNYSHGSKASMSASGARMKNPKRVFFQKFLSLIKARKAPKRAPSSS